MDKVEVEYKKYKNTTLSSTEKDYLDAIEALGFIGKDNKKPDKF